MFLLFSRGDGPRPPPFSLSRLCWTGSLEHLFAYNLLTGSADFYHTTESSYIYKYGHRKPERVVQT